MRDKVGLRLALGEVLSEPKPSVCFSAPQQPWQPGAVTLDKCTRMLYDAEHVFVNGEAWCASGKDARLLHELADRRALSAEQVRRASAPVQEQLAEWQQAGWLHVQPVAKSTDQEG